MAGLPSDRHLYAYAILLDSDVPKHSQPTCPRAELGNPVGYRNHQSTSPGIVASPDRQDFEEDGSRTRVFVVRDSSGQQNTCVCKHRQCSTFRSEPTTECIVALIILCTDMVKLLPGDLLARQLTTTDSSPRCYSPAGPSPAGALSRPTGECCFRDSNKPSRRPVFSCSLGQKPFSLHSLLRTYMSVVWTQLRGCQGLKSRDEPAPWVCMRGVGSASCGKTDCVGGRLAPGLPSIHPGRHTLSHERRANNSGIAKGRTIEGGGEEGGG